MIPSQKDFYGVKDLEEDLYYSDVYAVRKFFIDENNLYGCTFPQRYVIGKVNVASCYKKHKAPFLSCYCGFYAYDDANIWWGEAQGRKDRTKPGECKAIVRLSGKTVVCERGIRAERLEVIAITADEKDFAELQEKYPDLKIYTKVSKMLKDFEITPLTRANLDSTRFRKLKESLQDFCRGIPEFTRISVESSREFLRRNLTSVLMSLAICLLMFLSFRNLNYETPEAIVPLVTLIVGGLVYTMKRIGFSIGMIVALNIAGSYLMDTLSKEFESAILSGTGFSFIVCVSSFLWILQERYEQRRIKQMHTISPAAGVARMNTTSASMARVGSKPNSIAFQDWKSRKLPPKTLEDEQ